MSMRFEMVPFQGGEVLAVRSADAVAVVMKPVVEALGLDWSAQYRRINRHPVLSEGVAVMAIPSQSGTQETVTLELQAFHGWLTGISPDRISDPDKRDRVIAYQRRAFRAVFEHFHGRPDRAGGADRALAYRELPKLLRELEATRNPAARQLIHGMIVELCEERGYVAPALNEIGRAAPNQADMAAQFFDLLAKLEATGAAFDHSLDPGLLALRLREVEQLLQSIRPGFRFGPLLRGALKESVEPPFVGTKTIRSKLLPDQAPVHAWVFLRAL